ncbi:MAG: hypothetical protein KJ749_03360 [Planctomycetes bacterium]|nr:hypothetical protein [Planctomycetota bacterium]
MERSKRTTGAPGFFRADVVSVVMAVAFLMPSRLVVGMPPATASEGDGRSGQQCTNNAQCDDGSPCTADVCAAGTCVNTPIPGCVPCDPSPICSPVELVFIMDTSGSMRDEAEALCMLMPQIVVGLESLGITVVPTFLGITETPGGEFDCLTDDVVSLLGGAVPSDSASCEFPGSFSAYESWGPATAIVAKRFPWGTATIRVIVPMSDEGPCDGSFPDGCNNPGDDRASIDNAVLTANGRNVVVSPITGTSADECVLTLAGLLAAGTGGEAFQTTNPFDELFGLIRQIVFDQCEPVPCDDEDECTVNDICREPGICEGTPITTASCVSDADCFGFTCNAATGYCVCQTPDLTLTCPEDVSVNADAARLSATVTWDPVTVESSCAGPIDITCTATHTSGFDVAYLIEAGGLVPAGATSFECTATDACGGQESCGWVVNVSSANLVEVNVQLSAPFARGPIHRCIEFEFYANCYETPEVTQVEIRFGLPYDLPGNAREVEFKVPANKYLCVTARDPRHTLRSTAEMTIDDSGKIWRASFVGDPLLGGNWLIGGNVTGDSGEPDRVIDVLDAGVIMAHIVTHPVVNPNTACTLTGPHGDINGDGYVNGADLDVVVRNFMSTDKGSCCPSDATASIAEAATAVTIKELREMGLGHLAVADVNEDGVLSIDDVFLFDGFLVGPPPPDVADRQPRR